MLDPMTSISLAGNIVQFVDFSGKIISKVRELKNSASGSSLELFNSEIVAKDLLELSQSLKHGLRSHGLGRLSADDQALEDLCEGCISLAKNMLARLKTLKIKEDDGNLKIMLQALRAVWSEKDIEGMSTQLAEFRAQLQLRIFTNFKRHMDLDLLSRQVPADSTAKHLIEALRDNQDVFESKMIEQTKKIVDLHLETRKFNTEEHEATRSVIVDAIKQVTRKGYDGERRPPRLKATTKDEEIEIKRQAEDRILKSLLFPSITARYLQVAKAHEDTFEWIFGDPRVDDRYRWSSFAHWLQFGSGIYWISGKAGSGKSTLMKFTSDHRRTRELLSLWSSPMSPKIASFYFWNSGTPEQKSCNGLLRTLLYEVLSDYRKLIPIILPDQWQDEYIEPTEFYQRFQWDFGIMCETFDLLRAQNDLRLCIFIDGLDEYEADTVGAHADVVALFKTMVTSSNIKICASSRPWLVFEDAFRSDPSLQVQDLSSKDINRYVEDKLYGNARMIQLRNSDPVNTNFLVEEIVSKASGVFLWVVLVVKSLLDGLTNRDRISDLRRRLELLPADLEDLYKHMLLKHIDPFYHEQSAQIFRIVFGIRTGEYAISKEVNLLMLAFADEEDQNLSLHAPVQQLSEQQLWIKCVEMRDRLKSRCAGLLEISGDESRITELEVNFLHRTVYDFLKLPDIENMLSARTGPAFDPFERLLKGCVLWLKQVTVSRADDSFLEVLHLVRTALIYARQSGQLTRNSNLLALDELDKTAMHHWMSVPRITEGVDQRSSGLHWADDRNHRPASAELSHDNFMSLAVEYGLTEYVREKLNEDGQLVKTKSGRPLLHYLLGNGDCLEPEVQMAEVLLEHGADPNVEFNDWTISAHAFKNANKNNAAAATWKEIHTLIEDRRGYQESGVSAMIPWEARIQRQRQEKETKSVRSWLRRKLRKIHD